MTASSYAMIVRDEILARAKSMPFFATFKFGTNKAEQVQPEKIPFCGVYFISEDLTPDGDADVGEPRFRSSVLYGVSIVVQNNDAAAAENKLDEAWVLVADRIFRDPSLYMNPAAQIQAYVRGNRTHQFGSVGADNSIPVAECRFTLTCDLGTIDFPPVIDDDFNTLHVTTQWPSGGTPAEIAEVQQVQAEYDLPQNKEKENGKGSSEKR
jgi:hypothetical protein